MPDPAATLLVSGACVQFVGVSAAALDVLDRLGKGQSVDAISRLVRRLLRSYLTLYDRVVRDKPPLTYRRSVVAFILSAALFWPPIASLFWCPNLVPSGSCAIVGSWFYLALLIALVIVIVGTWRMIAEEVGRFRSANRIDVKILRGVSLVLVIPVWIILFVPLLTVFTPVVTPLLFLFVLIQRALHQITERMRPPLKQTSVFAKAFRGFTLALSILAILVGLALEIAGGAILLARDTT